MFTRVTTQSPVGVALFIVCSLAILGVSIQQCRRSRKPPYVLIGFTLACSVFAFLPIPNMVWMNREIIVLSIVGIIALAMASSKDKSYKKLLLYVGQALAPCVITFQHQVLANSNSGAMSVKLSSYSCDFSTSRRDGAITAGTATAWALEGKLEVYATTGEDLAIDYNDVYRDSFGRYLTGRQVAALTDDWVKHHPLVPRKRHVPHSNWWSFLPTPLSSSIQTIQRPEAHGVSEAQSFQGPLQLDGKSPGSSGSQSINLDIEDVLHVMYI